MLPSTNDKNNDDGSGGNDDKDSLIKVPRLKRSYLWGI